MKSALKRIRDIAERQYNRLVWVLQWLPYRPRTLDSKRFANKRSAENTIRLCGELGIAPQLLIDVGANESQWAYWFKRRWRNLEIVSFEPQRHLRPLGSVYHVALSDRDTHGTVVGDSITATVVEGSSANRVPVMRFETLYLRRRYEKGFERHYRRRRYDRDHGRHWSGCFPKHAILKIDAETHTARALAGFGELIKHFSLVVIEVSWDHHRVQGYRNQQALIWKFMLAHGFTHAACMDSDFYSGHIAYCDVAFWK